MFKAIRPQQIPQSLMSTSKDYRSHEIVHTLKTMFHGKCYLCERGNISDVNIEHLIPHKNDELLKFDWNNLFYACARCNNIKGYKDNILDCTVEDIRVDKAIELQCPSIDTNPVIVKAGLLDSTPEIMATIELLNLCYNDQNTALKGISRAELIEDLMEGLLNIITYRKQLLHTPEPLTEQEKNNIIEKLKLMCEPDWPFSSFWKWHIYRDSKLSVIVPVFQD